MSQQEESPDVAIVSIIERNKSLAATVVNQANRIEDLTIEFNSSVVESAHKSVELRGLQRTISSQSNLITEKNASIDTYEKEAQQMGQILAKSKALLTNKLEQATLDIQSLRDNTESLVQHIYCKAVVDSAIAQLFMRIEDHLLRTLTSSNNRSRNIIYQTITDATHDLISERKAEFNEYIYSLESTYGQILQIDDLTRTMLDQYIQGNIELLYSSVDSKRLCNYLYAMHQAIRTRTHSDSGAQIEKEFGHATAVLVEVLHDHACTDVDYEDNDKSDLFEAFEKLLIEIAHQVKYERPNDA